MKEVFILEHIIESEEGSNDEIKYIGVFSSMGKANEAIDYLKVQVGFKDYPIDFFNISKDKIDEYGWKEGFVKWKDSF